MAQREADQKKDFYDQESYVRYEEPLPGLAAFNTDYGFLEAILRGFRSGFVREQELRQMCQCTTLEDLRLAMGDTDYCLVLQNQPHLTPDIITNKLLEKYVSEFMYIRDQATGQLATFLDFITYEPLISNISFLIKSLIRGADSSTLLAKCQPLGIFPGLKRVLTFENSAEGLLDLYRTVLVDTPVAPYFETYFNSEVKGEGFQQIEQAYNEVEIEVINTMLQKLWLEDFYRFTQTLGGTTALMMKELLEFEADRRAISITISSFKTALNEQRARDEERRSLYVNFGKLYPEGIESFTRVGDHASLAQALRPYPVYYGLLQQAQNEGKSIEDALYAHEVLINRLAFESQSHFACFWAYHRLKQQEIRNVYWIASCIALKRDQKEFNRWIKIF